MWLKYSDLRTAITPAAKLVENSLAEEPGTIDLGQACFRVRDCMRYDVETDAAGGVTTCTRRANEALPVKACTDTSRRYNTIVLLLESPHSDEYEYRDADRRIITFKGAMAAENRYLAAGRIAQVTPMAPASGATGRCMDKHLYEVLTGCALQGQTAYKVIVANPVPYQASLHAFHGQALKGEYKLLRNWVWETLWQCEAVRQDFVDRLAHYTPEIILNCCTGELQPLVRSCLADQPELACARRYEGYHPYNWFCSDRLRLTTVI